MAQLAPAEDIGLFGLKTFGNDSLNSIISAPKT
jgi:hypothetical protein